MPPPALIDRSARFSSAAVLKTRPPALRSNAGTRDWPSGIRMSMGTADASVSSGATTNPGRRLEPSGKREAVALIVGRGSELATQVVRIDGTVAEGNLVVVGVVLRAWRARTTCGSRSATRAARR